MNAEKIAARFIAFTAYLNQKNQPVLPETAARYAREHWEKFLPYASPHLAHFLTKTREKLKRKSKNRTLAHASGVSPS